MLNAKRKKKNKNTQIEPFLNEELISEFREAINASPIFMYHDSLKHKYNLLCVLMDRLTSATQFLNAHSSFPKTEEDFVCFLVYATIIRDGINKIYENILNEKPPYISEIKYFSKVKKYEEDYFSPENHPTDEDFFEYIRALAFAHPYEVSKRGRVFLADGEKQCCPWVAVRTFPLFSKSDNAVGLRIYSNKFEEGLIDIYFSFDRLKDYVQSRYNCLRELTVWAKNALKKQENEWMETPIQKGASDIDTLKNIRKALLEQFQNTYTIDDAIEYLSCKLSNEKNKENVKEFRQAISSRIDKVLEYANHLDYENVDSALAIMYVCPKKMHQMANYQLEKIFSYLHTRSSHIEPGSDEEWGLIQAENFSEEFAKKWVEIDVSTMSYSEIKLLVCVACYLEAKSQG